MSALRRRVVFTNYHRNSRFSKACFNSAEFSSEQYREFLVNQSVILHIAGDVASLVSRTVPTAQRNRVDGATVQGIDCKAVIRRVHRLKLLEDIVFTQL